MTNPNNDPQTPGEVNLEDVLEDKKKELKEKEKDVETKVKERDYLKKDVIKLEKLVDEINKLSEDYGNAFGNLKRDIEEIVDGYGTMIARAESDPELKDQIETLKELIGNKEGSYNKTKSDLETTLNNAKGTYDGAKEARDIALKEFESAKSLQKELESQIKEINAFKKIVEEEKENRAVNMYYLLMDAEDGFKALYDQLKKKTETHKLGKLNDLFDLEGSGKPDEPDEKFRIQEAQDEFEANFTKKWKALEDAEKIFRNAEKVYNIAKKAYDEYDKKMKEFEKDRKKKVLEKFKD